MTEGKVDSYFDMKEKLEAKAASRGLKAVRARLREIAESGCGSILEAAILKGAEARITGSGIEQLVLFDGGNYDNA